MQEFNSNEHPHRRFNPLLNEWVLVSPHRAKRPWQGQNESVFLDELPEFDPSCYLCPENIRANGIKNPKYDDCFVFDNDFAAIIPDEVSFEHQEKSSFLKAIPERGLAKVVCFSPKHNLTIPEMEIEAIEKIIKTWQQEYSDLGKKEFVNYVQIFENKGSIMGCSNPHPHGQIWAQESLPTEVEKTQENLKAYYEKNGRTLLHDYLNEELKSKERIVIENEHFVALVPFWAIWPFETMIISKRVFGKITDFSQSETVSFAKIIK